MLVSAHPPILRVGQGVAERRASLAARRAQVERCVLQPYDPQAHGMDALLYFWARVEALGEHRRILGPWTESPTRFVQTYSQAAEMMFLHELGADWRNGHGLLAVVWADDVVWPCRARVSFWTAPAYRVPVLSKALGQHVLRYLFEARGFQSLCGLIPVTNPLSVRLARRMGFRVISTWPGACLDGDRVVDGVELRLVRTEWQAREPVDPTRNGA